MWKSIELFHFVNSQFHNFTSLVLTANCGYIVIVRLPISCQNFVSIDNAVSLHKIVALDWCIAGLQFKCVSSKLTHFEWYPVEAMESKDSFIFWRRNIAVGS